MSARRVLKWVLGGGVAVAIMVGAFSLREFLRQTNFSGMLGRGDQTGLQLPPGFTATVFASGLDGPRFIAFGPDGVLHVADRGNNRIVALPDMDGDGIADSTRVFAADVPRVHSIRFADGAWYAGVPTGVIRLQDSDGDGAADARE
ncbi:MAG: hypothetical protein ACE5FI_14280, partial [Anaerolineales bacterium]